jgi:hypothetical protein
VIAIAACAAGLRIALIGHWDAYGALQLPLVFETAAATVIAATIASPLGEPERLTGRWLPYLRLAVTLALTAAAAAALAAAGTGAHLAGGTLDVLRNVAGMTGLGLLVAVVTGGLLAWVGPLGYMMLAEIGLTAGWGNPWLWPGRPPHDLGGALCAGLVFAAGLVVTTVRGARDASHE